MSADRPVIAISQARLNSTRLPAKVLRPILGRPLLWWHLTRLQRATRLDGIIVATTEAPGSDPIAAIAGELGIPVHRGSEHDVLARYAGAADRSGAATIVRVTSDCPLIDPALVDQVIAEYLAHRPKTHYTSLDVESYPRGLDTEVFSRAALDAAMRESDDRFEHEHVTPFIWRRAARFGFRQLGRDEPAHYRFCVDETDDLALVTKIIEALAPTRPDFGWRDCAALLDADPALAAINAHVMQHPAR
ncbi:MAG: spore coat polysaccharide biosynthesis protein SpsF [Aliidongia sp.]|nr:spore coat polysaccharide biosynthesis protein SpsF [Aliidongia sp.]